MCARAFLSTRIVLSAVSGPAACAQQAGPWAQSCRNGKTAQLRAMTKSRSNFPKATEFTAGKTET